MPKYKVIYESTEEIYGIVPKAYDWVHYSSILSLKNGGKKPVSLEMTFVPPPSIYVQYAGKAFYKG